MIDKTIVQAELGRIYSRDGVLTPAAVIDEARPKDAPLHPAFEWDNKRAAEGFREWQARQLIRTVTITRENKGAARVYVNVRRQDDQGYHPVAEVVQRPDMLAIALHDLLTKINGLQSTVAALKDAADALGADEADKASRIYVAIEAIAMARDALRGSVQ